MKTSSASGTKRLIILKRIIKSGELIYFLRVRINSIVVVLFLCCVCIISSLFFVLYLFFCPLFLLTLSCILYGWLHIMARVPPSIMLHHELPLPISLSSCILTSANPSIPPPPSPIHPSMLCRDHMRRVLNLPNFIAIEYKKHEDSLADKSSYRNPSVVWRAPATTGRTQGQQGVF